MKKLCVFVSGHLTLTDEEFNEHYAKPLVDAVMMGCRFVVGDAAGCDTMVQEALSRVRAPYVVYHMFDKPRNNVADAQCVGGFTSDDERDAAMTNASDFDIAWVRPGGRGKKSGTMKNIKRRASRLIEVAVRCEMDGRFRIVEGSNCASYHTAHVPQFFVEETRDLVRRFDELKDEWLELQNVARKAGAKFPSDFTRFDDFDK